YGKFTGGIAREKRTVTHSVALYLICIEYGRNKFAYS
ncbi:MAG: hypothetical protein ACI90V_014391, partial [Bacillariaceae sp.]